MNLSRISVPFKGIMKVAPKGEAAVITVAAVAAVITGETTVSVLKDVYGVHWTRRRKNKNKKGEGVPVPSPENDDIIDDNFVDDVVDPAQNA